MKINKFIIVGLALIACAFLAVVALANNTLAIEVKSITGAETVTLQIMYEKSPGVWDYEGNISDATVGEYEHDRVNPGPHRIKIKSIGKNCKDAKGNEEIGDYPEVILDINVTNFTCTFELPGPPPPAVHQLTMNFYVHGLDNGTETTFIVRQYDIDGEIEGVAKNYDFTNTWPTTETQEMAAYYSYGEIWHNGSACEFTSGEYPARIDKEISTIHVGYNADAGDNCVLSLEPFALPVEYIRLDMKVNISGLQNIYSTPARLNYQITSAGVVTYIGTLSFYCDYNIRCNCSNGEAPVNGFCEETVTTTNIGDEHIVLELSRLKNLWIPAIDFCELDGERSVPVYELLEQYNIYASDPNSQDVICEFRVK